MASYRDWVPGRGTTEFKKIRPTTVKDPQTGTNITTYPIDLPDDKEWPEGATDPPNRTKTRVLPAKCFQLGLDFRVTPGNTGTDHYPQAFILMSVGSGSWIPGVPKCRGHYETEYFRAIILLQCACNYGPPDWDPGGWMRGDMDYIYLGPSQQKVSKLWVVKYNESIEFNETIYNKVSPYTPGDNELVTNRWQYNYNEILAKIEDYFILSDVGFGTVYYPEESSNPSYGRDENGNPINDMYVTFPDLSQDWEHWKVNPLLLNTQLNKYEYEANYSDIAYSIPEDAEFRLELLENVSTGILSLKGWYIRTLMGSSTSIYRHCAIDDVLGYDLISYTDKKKNLALSFSKDDKKWHSKIVIPANDPGIGIHPSIAVKDSGNIDYYWQKSGKAENATLGSEDVPPISGTGIAGVGIWSTRLNYIHDGDSGPISISNDAAGNRKENQIVAGGYNPVVVEDNQLGLDYLLYWSKSREDKDRIVTGSTGNAVPATITLGSIYAAIAKDGDFDAQPPVLILPHPNDSETAIPQQTVGAACKGNGDILLSWVDKDGTSYQQTVKVFEADAVVT